MNSTINKIAVVECYIHCMTDKNIRVSRPTTVGQQQLLDAAYTVAATWVNNNNVKLTLYK